MDLMTLRTIVTIDIKTFEAGVQKVKASFDQLKQKSDQTTSFSDKMKTLGGAIQGVGDKIQGVGRAITPVSVALGAVAASGVRSFAEVDRTMSLTNKTMSNTQQESKLLGQAMKDAASQSIFGMNDAAQAALNFARAGLDAKQAAVTLAPAMNLAAGESGNLDTVSSGLVATINGFHGSFEEAEHYANVFANACNNSALDVDSLSNAMSVAAPIFSSAGYSVNDAALYMGVMANNGIDANMAANSLKTGMARLVSPAKQGAEMIDKLGISVTNADGTMKNSVQVQQELHEAFSQLSESEQIVAASAIFGKNQMAPWLALINTAPNDVDKLSGALKQEGTVAEMAAAMMSGFGGSMMQLASSIDVAKYSLGEALAPAILKVAEKIQDAINWFNSLDASQQQTIAQMMVLVAALGPGLVIAGQIVSAVGSIVTALGGLTASSVGVIAAIGLITAAMIAFTSSNEELKKNISEIWGKLSETISAAVPKMLEAGKTMMTKIGEGLRTGIPGFLAQALPMVSNLSGKIREGAGQLVDSGLEMIKNIAKGIADSIPTLVENIPTIISNIAGVINDNAPKLLVTGVEIIATIGKGLIQAIPTIVANIPQILKAIWDVFTAYNWVSLGTTIITTIKNGFTAGKTAITNALKDIGSKASEAFKKINWAEAGKNAATAIINGIKALASTVSSTLKSLADAGAMAFKTVDWQAVGKTVIEFIANAAKAASTFIKSALQTLGKAGIEAFKNTDWKGVGKTAIEFIANAAKGAMNLVGTALKAIGKFGLDAFKSINWIQLGKDIINGIKSAGSSLISSLKNLAKEALQAAKDKLKIKSPSRVFRDEVGEMIPAGIALGINDNTKDVTKAMQDLSNMSITEYSPSNNETFASSMQDALRGINTGGINLNISVYGAPGQDEEALAQKISDRINAEVYRNRAVWGMA